MQTVKKGTHCIENKYKCSEKVHVSPSISDTRIDNDSFSFKHQLVSTDDCQFLDYVIPNDKAIFHNICSSVVDNNYSTNKVDGKVFFPQHDFYYSDSASIDSSAVHFSRI